MRRVILLHVSLFICTFAAAKVVIALAVCYQTTEIERFSCPKRVLTDSVFCAYNNFIYLTTLLILN